MPEPKPSPAASQSAVTSDGLSRLTDPAALALGFATAVVSVGTVLQERYEILQLLGAGGMGAVYKARDRELDRLVALKIIRPDLAYNPQALERFKQELILARKVTHKNVVRIYDIGDANGIKFITMEYLEGADLASILRERKKLPPEEAVEIIRQVCRALAAAHGEGVIHRDLKPQNIIREKTGKVLVMDFGLARSLGSENSMTRGAGLTQSGALVGTLRYMSPEQANGREVDARSDLFALGLIFYELLTGSDPYHAESEIASLVRRSQSRATPPSEIDAAIPAYISAVVSKCLEIDCAQRYQSALEILRDLDARVGPRDSVVVAAAPTRAMPRFAGKWAAVALVALALGGGGFAAYQAGWLGASTSAVAAKPLTLAIVPFRNASGDESLEWLSASLPEMLRTEVGQSARLSTLSTDRVHQVLDDLDIAADTTLDASAVRRLGELLGADRLVTGQYVHAGRRVRVDAVVHDIGKQKTVALQAEAADDAQLLATISDLARRVQENLALPDEALAELRAHAWRPSTASVTALRSYNEGLQLARGGKHLEAVKRFEAATTEDAGFALGFAKVAQTYSILGYAQEAEQASRQAVMLSEKLPPPEKFRVLAVNAQVLNDNQKAIESYRSLLQAVPDDAEVHFDLARLQEDMGSYDAALEHYRKVLERDPKNGEALLAVGRVEIKADNPGKAIEPLNQALTLAIQRDNRESKAATLHAIGVAYRLLEKPEEALRYYRESLEIKRELGDKRGIAAGLNESARVLDQLGRHDEALKSFEDAMQIRREIGDKRGLGNTLIDLGNLYMAGAEYDRALSLYQESLQIQRDVGNPVYEGTCLQNIGLVYLRKGRLDDALTYFERALPVWEKSSAVEGLVSTLVNLGDIYGNLGNYDRAEAQYQRAAKVSRDSGYKRGLGMASSSLGILYEYQGRYGAALAAQKEALTTFDQLRERGEWKAGTLGAHGHLLTLLGQLADGRKELNEALELARALPPGPVAVRTRLYHGDSLLQQDDARGAAAAYAEAQQLAERTGDVLLTLAARGRLAELPLREGRPQAALPLLRKVLQDGRRIGPAHVTASASVSLAEALLTRDTNGALRELQSALLAGEKRNMTELRARIHFLMGEALRQQNKPEAASHYAQSRSLLEAMAQEAKSQTLLERPDLARMYAHSADTVATSR